MNTRLLELLKNPDLLVLKDIEILEKEISKNPFVQSYRALYLLGMYRFNEKKYADKLSETAAFTTDKKILYNLIHKKEIAAETVQENIDSNEEAVKPLAQKEESLPATAPVSKLDKLIALPSEKFQEVDIIQPDLPAKVYSEGELNRILFEGEENFLNEESEEVDLEASQEAGTLVIASKNGISGEFAASADENKSELKTDKSISTDQNEEDIKFKNEEIPDETNRKYTPEQIIDENTINQERKELEESSNISFHGIGNEMIAENETLETENSAKKSEAENEEGTRDFTVEKIINEENLKEEKDVLEDLSEMSFHGIDPGINFTKEEKDSEKLGSENSENRSKNSGEEVTREFTKEKIINEDDIKKEENIVDDPSQLSFHGSQDFLPGVKMEIRHDGNSEIVPHNKASRHVDEMQKLLAEVEAKMKNSSSKKTIHDEVDLENTKTLNFTEQFHIQTADANKILDIEAKTKEDFVSNEYQNGDEDSSANFERSVEVAESKSEKKQIEYDLESEITNKFNENKLITENSESLSEEKLAVDSNIDEESNVPVFINTWQSWLQLKPTPKPSLVKENGKQKAIENFIEREPKISKLKEESSFSVKDKGDNISHLMTETLANLYLDQKLYPKAIKAFELLKEKYPEKADKFSEKLIEIKELRSQK